MLYGDRDLHQYSCWFADAVYKRYWVSPNDGFVTRLLAGLQDYYRTWETREKDGLFHYTSWMDGMEYSISGNLEERFRPTLNCYMYADALAIANIAQVAGNATIAELFSTKASSIKSNVQARLWNTELEFFATRDEQGGFTAAEIRHPQFLKLNPERLASWDGAIWPYATAQTLTAMQNLLRNYEQPFVTASDYMRELQKYAASQIRDGKPSISEVVRDPFVRQMSGSEHYNHSTFCDLVITGAAGIVPRPDDILEVSPLFPEDWEYFCLDGVGYRDHLVTIAWDRTGRRYGFKGFRVYIDKKKRYSSDSLDRVEVQLSS